MLATAGRILISLIRINMKKDFLYIKDTIMLVLFNIVILAVQFLFFDFLYYHTPIIKFVSFKQAMFLLATQQLIEIFYHTFFFNGFVAINQLIVSGKFDKFLLIPYYPSIILSLSEIDLKELFGIFFPLFLLIKYNLLHSTGNIFLYLILLLIGFGIRVYFGMFIRNLALTFVNILSLQNLESTLFGYSAFPYFIYKGVWKILFTVIIPVGVVANIGYAGVILSKLNFVIEGMAVLVIFYVLSRLSFRLFLKLYQSAGG